VTRARLSPVVLTLALVMAGAMVAQSFGRFTFGVVLPAVRDDLLGGSNGAAGFLGTANVVAYLVGTLAVAAAASRFSLVGLVRVGLVLSTAGLLLASVAPNGAVLAIALVAMGLGGAAIWIPSPRLAAAALPPERRGLAAGMVGMGIGLGIVFAGRLSDVFRHGQGDEAWRDVYLVEGLIGVVVLIAAVVLLRDGPDLGPSSAGGLGGFGALRRIEGWAALTGSYALYGFMYLLVLAFLVARLEDDAGFSADRASSMFALTGLAAVFGGVLLGPLSDRIGRRVSMVGAFVLFGVCALLILAGDQPWVALGALGVGLAFSGLPAVIAAYIVDATDATTYGPAYAAATLAFGVAQAGAPQVGGLLADWLGSFTVVFVASAALAFAGAIAATRLPPRGRAGVRN
jgi:MFS family permease